MTPANLLTEWARLLVLATYRPADVASRNLPVATILRELGLAHPLPRQLRQLRGRHRHAEEAHRQHVDVLRVEQRAGHALGQLAGDEEVHEGAHLRHARQLGTRTAAVHLALAGTCPISSQNGTSQVTIRSTVCWSP
mgnify:CR=1 FL=1